MTKEERKEKARVAAAKRYAADPERAREAARAYRAAHPERVRASSKRSREKYKDVYKERYAPRQAEYRARYTASLSPEQKKDRTLRKKYGITLDDYNRLWEEQGGACAICEHPFTVRPPHVDHDHATGEVRAILCQHCNQAVGMLFESPATAERLADYLRKHGKK